MDNAQDLQLLKQYVEDGSEQAFGTLVNKYMDMVYSSAMRRVGNQHLAEDVAQSVFMVLARKAHAFDRDAIVVSWLFRTTRFAALKAMEAEKRRKEREKERGAMAQNAHTQISQADEHAWQKLLPHLEPCMDRLREPDRMALLMRFFAGLKLRDIAENLGVSEGAAEKRVSRALDKLRVLLLKQEQVTTSLSCNFLAAGLAGRAVFAAPSGFAAATAKIAISSGAGTGSAMVAEHLARGVMKMIWWSKVKAVAVAACVVVGVSGGLITAAGAMKKPDKPVAPVKPVKVAGNTGGAGAVYPGYDDPNATKGGPLVKGGLRWIEKVFPRTICFVRKPAGPKPGRLRRPQMVAQAIRQGVWVVG